MASPGSQGYEGSSPDVVPQQRDSVSTLLKMGTGLSSTSAAPNVPTHSDSIIQAPAHLAGLADKSADMDELGMHSEKCVDLFLTGPTLYGGQQEPEPSPEPDVASSCSSPSQSRQAPPPQMHEEVGLLASAQETRETKAASVADALLFCSGKQLVSRLQESNLKHSEKSNRRKSKRESRDYLVMQFSQSKDTSANRR